MNIVDSTTNTASYYYSGGRLAAMSENGTMKYMHQDHLSGTALVTDVNGSANGTMKYYPFGGTRAGAVPTDIKFTGQRLDETGLYYYGARYYDATIGRFISPDTIIPNPADPQSFNRYSYCLNNPLKYADPEGHKVIIGGWDVRAIDAIMSAPGSVPAELCADVVKVASSPEFQAYNTIRSVDTYYTDKFEVSNTFTLDISSENLGTHYIDSTGNLRPKGHAQVVGSSSGVKMTFNTAYQEAQEADTMVKYLAHEFVHTHGWMMDRNDFFSNSMFEENLGDAYSAGICRKAGISYGDTIALPFDQSGLERKYVGREGYENIWDVPFPMPNVYNKQAYMYMLYQHPWYIYTDVISW